LRGLGPLADPLEVLKRPLQNSRIGLAEVSLVKLALVQTTLNTFISEYFRASGPTYSTESESASKVFAARYVDEQIPIHPGGHVDLSLRSYVVTQAIFITVKRDRPVAYGGVSGLA